MATCRKCIHWDKCSKVDGTTRFYGKEMACNNAEKLCEWFISGEEIERLKESIAGFALAHLFDVAPNADCWDEVIKQAKADTVRKMQERLKAEMRNTAKYSFGGREYSVIGEAFIDQIAKEPMCQK